MKAFAFNGSAPYRTNCFLLIGDNDRAVVIDGSANVNQIKEKLAENNAKLDKIFLTHGHHDHVETLNELRMINNAKVYMDKEDSDFFEIECDEYFTDGEVITVGDMKFEIIATHGHTPGCVCIYEEANDLLFTGDTLFAGSVGRCDLAGGDFPMLRESLVKLIKRVTKNPGVYPGHGEFTTMNIEKQQNPYLAKDMVY